MAAYERNTGSTHSLSGGIMTSQKRGTGSDQLTPEYVANLWYGTISVGTPPQHFTGVTLFSLVQTGPLTLCRIQWILTQGAVISSSLQVVATRPAQGTKRIIHLLAPPRPINTLRSRWSMEMVRMPAARYIMTMLTLPVWLYVELRFHFLSLQNAHTLHHRRPTRR